MYLTRTPLFSCFNIYFYERLRSHIKWFKCVLFLFLLCWFEIHDAAQEFMLTFHNHSLLFFLVFFFTNCENNFFLCISGINPWNYVCKYDFARQFVLWNYFSGILEKNNRAEESIYLKHGPLKQQREGRVRQRWKQIACSLQAKIMIC